MSVQYGIWKTQSGPVDPEQRANARLALAPYAPDGIDCHLEQDIAFYFCPLAGTREARREQRAIVARAGDVLVWDGRLDNRNELLSKLGEPRDSDRSDAEIVAACYRSWSVDCFASLLGDWALAIWESATRALVLAKDFIGTRHLYYRVERSQVTWSTVIDPLVGERSGPPDFDFEYLAGCLSFLPAAERTPYKDVFAVPPSSFVRLHAGRVECRKYWEFNPSKTIRHGSDRDYETHFLNLVRDSVRRRLRADGPVTAELSGGMDSSSIVCVADTLDGFADGRRPDLQTISYYSDSEPDWDEKPYFERVEQLRGRTGSHIDVGPFGFFQFEFDSRQPASLPGSRPLTQADLAIARCMQSAGSQVLLSGLGGDEVLGGVPTPLPELADLLASVRLRETARRLKTWALALRRPWLHLLGETARDFLPKTLGGVSPLEQPAPWIRADFAKRYRKALGGYSDRIAIAGARPSFQYNLQSVDALGRTLAWLPVSPEMLCERRYPYLDRTLLEFLFAIPREQLVRPGERRSLMRRALRGIVPPEIVNRRRKAFVSRAPRNALAKEAAGIVSRKIVLGEMGIVDAERLLGEIRNAAAGKDVALVPLVRTITLECWLRHVLDQNAAPLPAEVLKGRPHFFSAETVHTKGGEITHEL